MKQIDLQYDPAGVDSWTTYDTMTFRSQKLPPAPPPPPTGGQHSSHVGKGCSDGDTCQPGWFCNYDGDEPGVDGFCEPCLDCGSPDDDWVGCGDCGLPAAGAADCSSQCPAFPDVVAANAWKITNSDTIGDHWIISEISMYADRDCSELLTPASVQWSDTSYDPNCESDTECSLFFDGECNTSGGCCDSGSGQWAGGDGAEDQAPGGTWVSYMFSEPVTVQCVAVCHSEEAHQQMLAVALQYDDINDSEGFQNFDILNFENAESSAEIGACSIDNPCPPNNFCNFDDGDEGRCEACVGCDAPVGCGDCGLPVAGAADCADMCTGDRNGRIMCSYPNNPCPDAQFCNFDHGGDIGGYCEACDDCDGYTQTGCSSCGLPGAGADHCFASCRDAAAGGGGGGTGICLPEDSTGDDKVNVQDLLSVLANFGCTLATCGRPCGEGPAYQEGR